MLQKHGRTLFESSSGCRCRCASENTRQRYGHHRRRDRRCGLRHGFMAGLRIATCDEHVHVPFHPIVTSASSTLPCMHTDPSDVLTLLSLPYGRVWETWLRTKDLCKFLAAFVRVFAFLWLACDTDPLLMPELLLPGRNSPEKSCLPLVISYRRHSGLLSGGWW